MSRALHLCWRIIQLIVLVPIALVAGVCMLWLILVSPFLVLGGAFGLMPSALSRDLAMLPAGILVLGAMALGILRVGWMLLGDAFGHGGWVWDLWGKVIGKRHS